MSGPWGTRPGPHQRIAHSAPTSKDCGLSRSCSWCSTTQVSLELSGGYVGVDVFFVISGFVITGVLLREKASSGRTSILSFYGRRCRRILPAATVVIVVTVVLSYVFLGIVGGNQTATDGVWATIFLANFHFASVGTNYLTEFQPPSPLQNFWTLSVEEQFYLVYPTLFLLVGTCAHAVSFRARLAIVLGAVIALSFALSVSQTAALQRSPFSLRSPGPGSWLSGHWSPSAPHGSFACHLGWRWRSHGWGLASSRSPLCPTTPRPPTRGPPWPSPSWVPRWSSAGGTVLSRHGAESLLRLWPFRQLGKLSYSLYLWHWPILILAAESVGKSTLPVKTTCCGCWFALGLSIISYVAIENPVRHSRPLNRNRLLSIGLGAGLIALTLTVVVGELHVHAATYAPEAMKETANLASVESLVASAPSIHSVPANLDPPLGVFVFGYPVSSGCGANSSQTSVPPCLFGDPHGTHTMVVVGDSHAQMWFYTINAIATKSHWRLWFLAKSACPDPLLPYT